MQFSISTDYSKSGIMFNRKDAFIERLSDLIDICAANGGSCFDVEIDSDANCNSIDSKKWNEAITYLDKLIVECASLGKSEECRLYEIFVPLKIRYKNGERSANLYENIMRFR